MIVDIDEAQKHHVGIGQVLGGKKTFRNNMPETSLDWAIQIIDHGMPFDAVESFVDSVDIPQASVNNLLGVDRKTAFRRKRAGFLTHDESNNLYEYAKTFSEAVTIIGSIEKARRWIKSPIKALGNKSPLEMMKTSPGADEVMDILMRIEHGGYS